MTKLNTAQICSLRVVINEQNTQYVYKKAKKFLFFKYQEEGYYNTLTFRGHKLTTIEEIESEGKLFCKDEKVYHYPHLKLQMSDNNIRNIFFETEEELNEVLNSEEMKAIKWITINGKHY